MKTKDLEYPVLQIDKKGYMWVSIDEDTLTTARSHSLKTGWYKGMILVDSGGRSVKVKDIRFISGKGKYRGYYTMFLDRFVRIELIFDDKPCEISFEKLKKKIISDFKRHSGSMDAESEHSQLRQLQTAKSVRELIGAVRIYGDIKELHAVLGRPMDFSFRAIREFLFRKW